MLISNIKLMALKYPFFNNNYLINLCSIPTINNTQNRITSANREVNAVAI